MSNHSCVACFAHTITMVLKHYKSGLDLILDQAQMRKDWITLLSLPAARSLVQTSAHQKRCGILKPSRVAPSPASSLRSRKTVHFGPARVCMSERGLHYDDASFNQPSLGSWSPSFDPSSVMWRFWKWHNDTSDSDSSFNSLLDANTFQCQLESSCFDVYSTFALRNLAMAEYPRLFDYFAEPLPDVSCGATRTPPRALRSYFIFKNGVPPLWEDDYNVNGGRWQTIVHPHDGLDPATIKHVWTELILILTENMIDWLEEICGIAMTIRSNGSYKISIWNRCANNTLAKLMIGQIMKDCFGISSNMFYYSHQMTMGKLAKRQLHH